MSASLHYGHKLYNRTCRLKVMSFMILFITSMSIGWGQANVTSEIINQDVAPNGIAVPFVFDADAFVGAAALQIECITQFRVQYRGDISDGDVLIFNVNGSTTTFTGSTNNCAGGTTFSFITVDGTQGGFDDDACVDLATTPITVSVTRINTNSTECASDALEVRLLFQGAQEADVPTIESDFPTTYTVTAADTECSVSSADILSQVLADADLAAQVTDNCASAEADYTVTIDAPAESYDLTCGGDAHTVTLVISDGCGLSEDATIEVDVIVTEDDLPTATDPTGASSAARIEIALSEDACNITEADLLESILDITMLEFTCLLYTSPSPRD